MSDAAGLSPEAASSLSVDASLSLSDATSADAFGSGDGFSSTADANSSADFFLVTYVAGTTASGPAGINGSVGLESGANQVALTSLSDLLVSGSEQTTSTKSTNEIYRFSGVDGSLLWKYPSAEFLSLVGVDDQDNAYVVSVGAGAATVITLGPSGTPTRPASAPVLGGVAETGGHIGGCVMNDGTTILAASSRPLDDGSTYLAGLFQRMMPDGTLDWITTLPNFIPPWARVLPTSPSTAIVLLADQTQLDEDGSGAPALGLLNTDTGAITTVDLALPATAAATVPTFPLDAALGPSGDVFILLGNGWLVDALPDGSIRNSVEVTPTIAGFSGPLGSVTVAAIARTVEGVMVVGSALLEGNCSVPCGNVQPVAERYDVNLNDLGAYSTQGSLDLVSATWAGISTRDGAVALAGTLADETILLAKAHY